MPWNNKNTLISLAQKFMYFTYCFIINFVRWTTLIMEWDCTFLLLHAKAFTTCSHLWAIEIFLVTPPCNFRQAVQDCLFPTICVHSLQLRQQNIFSVSFLSSPVLDYILMFDLQLWKSGETHYKSLKLFVKHSLHSKTNN